MKLTLNDQDFVDILGQSEADIITGETERLSAGPSPAAKDTRVLDAIPKVLAGRFARMLPDGFELLGIQLKVTLGGAPFGVGVSGEATVTYGPRPLGAGR